MEITEEQRERMRKNRERAMELKRKKKEAEEKEQQAKKQKMEHEEERLKRKKEDEGIELENFEVDASDYVTKTEATKMYCLPAGTLAVCKVVEKENPKHKSWTPMKLYFRSEIRRRARDRFGGIEGLRTEREKRAKKRYNNDMENVRKIF